MELAQEWVDYDGPDGTVSAYLVRPQPAHDPLPGVLVLQEVWGVDEHIQDIAERLAAAGYVALAPDLYSAGGGRPETLATERVAAAKAFLNALPPGQWTAVMGDEQRRAQELGKLPDGEGERVGETLGVLFGGARDPERHVRTLAPAVEFLRSHSACGGRPVGAVGFCLGGGLVARLAAEDVGLGAAIVFYGASPEGERVAAIGCPLRGFYGQEDPRIVGGLADFQSALAGAGVDHELRVYPATGHAFFNDTRPSYRPEAARDAWGASLAFFAATLGKVATVDVAQAASEAA